MFEGSLVRIPGRCFYQPIYENSYENCPTWESFPVHSLKLTVRTCQEAIPKGNDYSNHPFSGAMLVTGKVTFG